MHQQDVYDETYRKAGKMDVDRFATQFHPANHGIIEAIRDVLLGNRVDLGSIHVELYKLNVYGRCSNSIVQGLILIVDFICRSRRFL